MHNNISRNIHHSRVGILMQGSGITSERLRILSSLLTFPPFPNRLYRWEWLSGGRALYHYAATQWGHHARSAVEEMVIPD
ncbi:hypothetical protein SERLADRAFT_471147 [Serpula lacrymans var. lacrymans S7.9]|uniref:Uncharacterized protein n=1 Tax=Serpula lacrymans var. lacrymans (strain S7.9) TaxID=578457 RepID=F8P0S4_SERL9|nr:uncharacterized protein SERLADRAFT_471147 [Serpula lacrymans var. lacrymans S7.9]EGO22758.1 hypothetical protein SERLADRAFT_471147 [Serpula lacrymans var. lacrymans S7.9]